MNANAAKDRRIGDYVDALSRALSGLPETDRADILAEIRSHLEHRAGEGRLDEALKALGAPASCARSFLDELKLQSAFTDAGPAVTFGALLALATRRATAFAGLFVSGIFFLFALAFGSLVVIEIVSPDAAGLWIDLPKDTFVLGSVDGLDPSKEVLGAWMIPVAAALGALALVIAQGIGRLFIRWMMKK